MHIAALFLVNAVLNFVLSLIVARFLGPEAFGQYAIAFAASLVINTLLLDWLKLSATRFYSLKSREHEPEVRASLNLLFAVMSLLIASLAGILIVSGVSLRLPTVLVAITAITAVATGLYDYTGALARARFHDAAYARLLLVKNVVAFVVMTAGAWIYESASIVMAGYVISIVAGLLTVQKSLLDTPVPRKVTLHELKNRYLRQFARYGIPLVIANALYQGIPLVNRSAAAAGIGLAEAGFLSLAADTLFRLFASIGSSLDIYLFQLAVRQDVELGKSAAGEQIAHNLTIIIMVMLPACTGFALVLPFFESLFVPTAFQGPFAGYALILIPALFCLCIVQYGLNPIFQLAHETLPVTIAAITGFLIDVVAVTCLPPLWGPSAYAVAHLCGMASAMGVCAVLARSHASRWPAWRHVFSIVLATALMTVVLWPLRQGIKNPLVALSLMIPVGCLVYGSIIFWMNPLNVRAFLIRPVDTAGEGTHS